MPAVSRRLRPLLDDGRIATCAIVDLEVLYSSRNLSDYEDVLDDRRRFSAAITSQVIESAIGLQHELAKRGQHRLPIPDLVISATVLAAGLVVLHYDADFERIAEAGGAGQKWVVPKGSI